MPDKDATLFYERVNCDPYHRDQPIHTHTGYAEQNTPMLCKFFIADADA